MNYEEFWGLIDKTSSASHGDGDMQADLLVNELIHLSTDEILRFNEIFQEYMDRAYNRDLWAAAYIINCGCSSDGFMDFRAWLIGQGRIIFENALSDPESLIDVVTPQTVTLVQKLMNVAKHAYVVKKGVAMPSTSHSIPDLIGDKWDESILSQKYPRLHDRFGDCEGWRQFFEGGSEAD
ncbi:MAG: DUF4240 domain-containing protein [Anaerolineaceae bacterium]|nr:DUF4240 domain-containing protein [Anaerolineaceae bacterium]